MIYVVEENGTILGRFETWALNSYDEAYNLVDRLGKQAISEDITLDDFRKGTGN